MGSLPPERGQGADPGRTTVYRPDDSDARPRPTAPPRPEPSGRYTLQEELGRGAMGVVYAAMDRVLDRAVAVKEFSPSVVSDPQLMERFEREARSLARLTHPNIVQVYDLLEETDRLWMVIELVEGGDAATLLSRRGRLDPVETARIGAQVAEGLAYAHGRGVVHRDVKPANVLLTRDGTAKVADFGIAKMLGSGQETVAGTVFGSPSYMSPEQASGATRGRPFRRLLHGCHAVRTAHGPAPVRRGRARGRATDPPGTSRWHL